jgi:hypothetical protein
MAEGTVTHVMKQGRGIDEHALLPKFGVIAL